MDHLRYPEPKIILPTKEHTHTIILLHGRGSNGHDFADEFLEGQISSKLTLLERFPTYKWVFPSSQNRYSTVWGQHVTEWFDIYSLEDPELRPQIQIEGLRTGFQHISNLIKNETTLVPESHVVLGGISQGCATSVLVLIKGLHRLGGFIGLCGWLPFRSKFEGIARPIAEASLPEASSNTLAKRLEDFYSETLGLESKVEGLGLVFDTTTPVLLSHASNDRTIDVELGRGLATTLVNLGMNVTWKEYEEGGHWINEPKGYDDLEEFLEFVFSKER